MVRERSEMERLRDLRKHLKYRPRPVQGTFITYKGMDFLKLNPWAVRCMNCGRAFNHAFIESHHTSCKDQYGHRPEARSTLSNIKHTDQVRKKNIYRHLVGDRLWEKALRGRKL